MGDHGTNEAPGPRPVEFAEVWRDGRLIAPAVSETVCVHFVGVTPGMWCGACNIHPDHPDLHGQAGQEGSEDAQIVPDVAVALIRAASDLLGEDGLDGALATWLDEAADHLEDNSVFPADAVCPTALEGLKCSVLTQAVTVAAAVLAERGTTPAGEGSDD